MTDNSITPFRTCTKCEQSYPETTEYFASRTFDSGNTGLLRTCRACVKAQKRQHYETHRDAKLEHQKAYYDAHRQERLTYATTYRINNIELVRARSSNYYQSHKDVERVKHQTYYRATRDERCKKNRAYKKANKAAINGYNQTRRARKRNSTGVHTADDIRILLKSQRNKCWWCDKKIKGDDYHVDHRIPLSRGGSNAPENLCISCPECNLSKGSKLPQEWNGRLL